MDCYRFRSVDDNGKVTAVNDGDGTVTACSLAATNICATVNVTVPAGTIIKPTPKNSTTFYFKAEGYTSGNTKLRYRLLAEGNEDWSTEDTDPVLSNATNCSGWLSVTIDNPGLKAVEFLFYQGDSWYHSGSASSSSNLLFRRVNRQWPYRTIGLSTVLPPAAVPAVALVAAEAPPLVPSSLPEIQWLASVRPLR